MSYQMPRVPRAGDKLRADWGNSLVRAISSMRPVPTPGVLLGRSTYGTTMTFEDSGAAAAFTPTAVLPFTVRWYSYGEEGKGQWQIYLPVGCATLTQTTKDGSVTFPYIPTNAKAKNKDGEVIPGWYEIPMPEEGVDEDVTTADGYAVLSWVATILFKPWPRMKVTAMPSKETEAWAWTQAAATMQVAEYSDDRETRTWAENTLAESGVALVEQTWDASGDFAVEYAMPEGSETTPNAKPLVRIVNQRRYLGRLDAEVSGYTDATQWTGETEVLLKVEHDSEDFVMSVERNLTGAAAKSDDDKTVGMIYRMKDSVVTEDRRGLFPTTAFYTSAESQTAGQ